MKDKLNRTIDYLRVSVTQRCNLNCVYCGKESPSVKELTAEQFLVLLHAFAELGFSKYRFTGGEPLVRTDICELINAASKIKGVKTIGLTTNGIGLKNRAQDLKNAGVSLLNVSLDTIDPFCYAAMTGYDVLTDVLDGLEKALSLDFERVKINAVLIRGRNEKQADRLLTLARDFPLDVRFIELMPFSILGKDEAQVVSTEELLQRFPFLRPMHKTDGTAELYSAPGFQGRIGFISPISRKFCGACNRVRLLADGSLKPCLGNPDVFTLAPYLNDHEKLTETIREIVYNKPSGHHFESRNGDQSAMNKIGG